MHIGLKSIIWKIENHIPYNLCYYSGRYPMSETAVYDEDYNDAPQDFVQKLTADWEAAAKIPSGCPTRSVQVRTGD